MCAADAAAWRERALRGGWADTREDAITRQCKLETCRKPFTTKSRQQRYCSDPCAKTAAKAIAKGAAKRQLERRQLQRRRETDGKA